MIRDALQGAPWLSAMARVFHAVGVELYIVGGAVRNPLMGLPLSDIDVCGPARPEEVCAFCEGTEVHAHLRAAHFGTVELHLTDEAGARHMAEYTTWREDSYRCGHRPDSVKFTLDIGVDALRRDFSVNALYRRVYPDHLGEVIDPTGGLAHLKDGVLHTVTPDPDRVLGDDGLRILRAARFQAELDLAPTQALMESLRRNAPLLRDIACERLRDELQKTLMADLRYPMLPRRFPGTASGLKTIHSIGAWPYLFGGMPYDEAAVSALVRMPGTLPERMALLWDDADAAHDAMLGMRFSVRDARQTREIVTAMQQMDASHLFELARLGRDALTSAEKALTALGDEQAVLRARGVLSFLADKPMSLKELAVTGDDLKPLFAAAARPMSEMGRMLNQLWRMAVEGKVSNEKEALLAIVRNLSNSACPL